MALELFVCGPSADKTLHFLYRYSAVTSSPSSYSKSKTNWVSYCDDQELIRLLFHTEYTTVANELDQIFKESLQLNLAENDKQGGRKKSSDRGRKSSSTKQERQPSKKGKLL